VEVNERRVKLTRRSVTKLGRFAEPRGNRCNLRLKEGRSAESRVTNGAKLECSYAEILVPISSTSNHIPYYPKRFAVLGQSSEKFNRPVLVANASPSVLFLTGTLARGLVHRAHCGYLQVCIVAWLLCGACRPVTRYVVLLPSCRSFQVSCFKISLTSCC
jgi:hypothetical protein